MILKALLQYLVKKPVRNVATIYSISGLCTIQSFKDPKYLKTSGVLVVPGPTFVMEYTSNIHT